PAVDAARRRDQYIPCPACGSTAQRYLFHRTGVRFVRCRACNLAYADPVDPAERAYFDIGALGQHDEAIDREHLVSDFAELVTRAAARYEQQFGRAPRRTLLVGRWHPDFVGAVAGVTELELAVRTVPDETTLVTRPLVESLGERLESFDIVL